jgi:hypothetical protein
MIKNQYLYRRQYVLGNKAVEIFGTSKKLNINKKYWLTYHPDLEVTDVSYGKTNIILLGYFLDPSFPDDDNKAILDRLIRKIKNEDDLFDGIKSMCGRYVIIASIDGKMIIFSDTAGLKQVFYYIMNKDEIWFASQPHLLAKIHNLQIDDTIKTDLFKTQLFRKHKDNCWYPDGVTLYKEINHLTPNHYVNTEDKMIERYWPKKRLNRITVEEGVSRASKLLMGIMKSGKNRFNLAFGISAGWDSRLLLSSCREVKDGISFFSQCKKEDISKEDIAIPSAMLTSLGIKHNVILVNDKIEPEFQKAYYENVFTARANKDSIAYSIKKNLENGTGRFVVTYGNLGEITRRGRSRFPHILSGLITPASITAMAYMTGSKVALKAFAKWLREVKKLRRYNLYPLDLCHWEQLVGSWAAMTFSEYDIAFDVLCPFHEKMIKEMWPELLKYEINPKPNNIKEKIRSLLYRLNLFDYVKYVYLMAYSRYR